MFFPASGDLSPERREMLQAFQKRAHIRFRSLELLNLSFTHRSYCNENSSRPHHNERLEFLGDSILGMIVASRLYAAYASKPEGELARIKSFVVSEDTLAALSLSLGIDSLLLMGKGEEHSGGRTRKAILANALEALIGASYLDSGMDAVSRFVLGLIEPEIAKVLQNRHRKDFKTIIQEYVQKFMQSHPEYESVRQVGPDHDRTFWISCSIGAVTYPPASGKNKKEAEQAAAKVAYDAIMASGGLEAARLTQVEDR